MEERYGAVVTSQGRRTHAIVVSSSRYRAMFSELANVGWIHKIETNKLVLIKQDEVCIFFWSESGGAVSGVDG